MKSVKVTIFILITLMFQTIAMGLEDHQTVKIITVKKGRNGLAQLIQGVSSSEFNLVNTKKQKTSIGEESRGLVKEYYQKKIWKVQATIVTRQKKLGSI